MGLSEDLGAGRTGIDTALFIYFIEEDPRFLPLVTPIFADLSAGRRQCVTSALSLLELLVVAYRSGDDALATRYEQLLAGSRGLLLVDISRDQLRSAARLRARFGMKAPDALQLSAALCTGCSTFVTNARRLVDIPDLRILQLSDY